MKLYVIMIKESLNSSGGSSSNNASSQCPNSNSCSSGALGGQIENSRFSSIKIGDQSALLEIQLKRNSDSEQMAVQNKSCNNIEHPDKRLHLNSD